MLPGLQGGERRPHSWISQLTCRASGCSRAKEVWPYCGRKAYLGFRPNVPMCGAVKAGSVTNCTATSVFHVKHSRALRIASPGRPTLSARLRRRVRRAQFVTPQPAAVHRRGLRRTIAAMLPVHVRHPLASTVERPAGLPGYARAIPKNDWRHVSRETLLGPQNCRPRSGIRAKSGEHVAMHLAAGTRPLSANRLWATHGHQR